jgi:alkylation response protein AidB-like acyl-CoA dehydrogenase
MLPLTLIQHATREQQERFLRPAFSGEQVWCQLFSEPGAGSDLAGLATRAVRDGDDWVVNGQKVWTSLAHRAKWGMLLARTQPELPKHQGITYFLIDMEQPGVRVRPLRQINGASEFNEVFLDDALVPDGNRLGDIGAGWRIAGTTLSSERAALSGAGTGKANIGGSGISRLIELAMKSGRWDDPYDRARVVDLFVESTLIRYTNLRNKVGLRSGRSIGAEGSVTKLFAGLHNRRLQEAMIDFTGASGTAWTEHHSGRSPGARAALGFLRAQANTIEGGTSNVLRDVLAERVLGMPRDPGNLDRNTPWKDIPRS